MTVEEFEDPYVQSELIAGYGTMPYGTGPYGGYLDERNLEALPVFPRGYGYGVMAYGTGNYGTTEAEEVGDFQDTPEYRAQQWALQTQELTRGRRRSTAAPRRGTL